MAGLLDLSLISSKPALSQDCLRRLALSQFPFEQVSSETMEEFRAYLRQLALLRVSLELVLSEVLVE